MWSGGLAAGRIAGRPDTAGASRHPLARVAPVPAAFRRAELVLARQDREVGARPTRVPPDAFVAIQTSRRLPPPPQPSLLPPPRPVAASSPSSASAAGEEPSGANDNKPRRPSTPWTRAVLREVALLALLAATLLLTYYAGRLHAAEHVIIVPGPSSYRSVVT